MSTPVCRPPGAARKALDQVRGTAALAPMRLVDCRVLEEIMMVESARVLDWSEQLATGLTEVDQQHRQLIDIINALASLRANHAAPAELDSVLNDLRDYSLYHFRTEGDLMGAWPVNQANKAAHLKAHQSFITYIEKARALMRTSSADVVDHLLAFLVKWLVHHITGVDARMAGEIHALRCGAPAPPGTDKGSPHAELIDTVSDLYDSIGVRTFEMLELNARLQAEIEQRQRTEQELILARDAAAASARAKSHFIANMSHEIRTPMNGMLGMIELACDTELTPEQREYLEFARSSANGLLTLVNELLDFSKIDAHKLTLERRPFDLRKCVHDLAGPIALRARQSGLEFGVEIDARLPHLVLGDLPRLRQVLLNLVGNALKFTAQGAIGIEVALASTGADGMLVRFAVKDSGIGIAAEQQRAVFEPFSQADASISRHYGGTGLGLTICSELVKLMDGRIWVDSTAGQGSTFYFTARFAHAAQDAAYPAASDAPRRRPARQRAQRILLVEDNQVNQKFALTVLGKAGHHATLATDGQAALELLRGQPFDAILMDLQMPGMDGFTAARLIRRMGIATPIIAMTAHARPGLHDAIMQAGMNGYLAKPVRAQELLERIELAVAGAAWTAGPPAVCDGANHGADAPVVDLDLAARAVDGDTEHLKVMAQMVLDQIDTDLQALRLQVAAQDSESLQQMSHRLKGSLGCVAASRAFSACKELEALAGNGCTAGYADALAKLEMEIDRLSPCLREIVAGQFVNA